MPAPIAVLAARKAAAAAARRIAARAAAQATAGTGGKKLWQKGIAALVLLLGAAGMTGLMMFSAIVGVFGAHSAQASCVGDTAQSDGGPATGAYDPIMPGKGMYLPSDAARDEIPPRMVLAAIRAAARYPGLDWTLIAGQMYQETRYGQDPSAAPGGDNGFGYKGILQFGDSAWAQYGADGNGDGKRDVYNVEDAAFGTANYLHALKAETQPWTALQEYSGSTTSNTTYMRVVSTQAARYRGVFTSDQSTIDQWERHLADTAQKNPTFPTLGKPDGIPEPVTDSNANVTNAAQIPAATPQSWATPPLSSASGNSGAPEPTPSSPGGQAATVTSAGWQWPLKQGTYTVATSFGDSSSGTSTSNTGIDLDAPNGTPVDAPADGTVISTGNSGDDGNLVKLRHSGGVVTLYAHLSSISVSKDQKVKRGDRIGAVGATGNVTSAQLHWEVRIPGVRDPNTPGQNNGPGPIDPKQWMDGTISANPADSNTAYADNQTHAEQCAADAGGAIVLPDGAGATGPLPAADSPVVRAALAWAQTGLGKPYVYGAQRLQGPNPADFDCSSFTEWAYYQATGGKLDIGSTTYDQLPKLSAYKVPDGQEKPGDLVFFGTIDNPEHVGIVWDPTNHQMINAPNPRTTVRFESWDTEGSSIVGFYRVPIPAGTAAVSPNATGSASQ